MPSELKVDYSDDFKLERLKTNLQIEKNFAIILTILSSIMFIVQFSRFNPTENANAITNVFYLRAFILVFNILALLIMNKIIKNNLFAKGIAKYMHYSYIGVTLIWSILLVINAQYIHGQITAYIITLFCLSTIIHLDKIERFTFIGLSYTALIFGITKTPITTTQLYGHIINGTHLVVLAYYISYRVYKQYEDNYQKTKKIKEDSETILKLNNELEKTIRRRTTALIRKHKRLVEEIHRRYDTSLELLKVHNKYTTEKYELEKAIEQEKVKILFLTNMSHELRTPLNIIFSAQQMIDSSLEGELDKIKKDKIIKFSRMIKQNSYRLIRLINNLIDITKIDAGNYIVRKRNVDIVKLMEDIYNSFYEYISNKKIKATFNSYLTSKIIACDPEQIERIVLNLLANAAKFLPSDGVICVEIYEKDNMFIFKVEDNGIGIPAELHEAIFERFMQVDKTITRSHEGSGIGLSIVKNFVDMHGGNVYVKSEVGKGSTFFVELPMEQMVEDDQEVFNKDIIANNRIEKINIEFSDIYFRGKGVS